MGANHTDDGGIGGVDMGIRGTSSGGRLRASHVASGLVLESGNALVAAVVNIALATLLCLSVIALIFSAYHGLIIRDAAVAAAANSAKAGASNQHPYLMRMLDDSLPALASYRAEFSSEGRFVKVTVTSSLPGFGLLQSPPLSYTALSARETVD